MGINAKLHRNNYIILPNLIDKDEAKDLANQFKLFCEDNKLKGDWLVEKSYAYRNYLPFLEILLDKTHYFSKLLGEPLLPTFSYSRIYYNKSVLPVHKDQQNCEIAITINLDCDMLWDIMIRTPYPDHRTEKITLNPGDAMLYYGTEALHWREEFQGTYYCGLFLCYVRSRGKLSSLTYEQMYTHGPGVFYE